MRSEFRVAVVHEGHGLSAFRGRRQWWRRRKYAKLLRSGYQQLPNALIEADRRPRRLMHCDRD